jgi:hypothetical protein
VAVQGAFDCFVCSVLWSADHGRSYPDRVRGIFNEGGLAGERAGWHLPGFDDSAWSERSPSKGFKHAGVGVFRTTFELDLLEGLDVPMAVRFSDETALYRVQVREVSGRYVARSIVERRA